MVAPYARREVVIDLEGPLVSEPYVEMTIRMMQEFGVGVSRPSPKIFRIPGDQRYWMPMYFIEPDASAASYFFGASAISQGKVTVLDLTPPGCTDPCHGKGESIQGDLEFVRKLEIMGCQALCGNPSGTIIRGAPTKGIDVDMNAISDTVMTLAAVACFAEGSTTIRNVAHIRHKETDRIAALATELRRVGAEVEEYPDGLKITPRPLHGAEIETYNDHRMAMSMALIGLKVPGIVIKNPGCVAKTYPGYWDDFQLLYK
jgi:3-phosphoshikimate 1-carboxyvinyltransferase